MFGKNGSQKIDAGLGLFDKAEKQILEGIKANQDVVDANLATVAAAKEAVIKLEEKAISDNATLIAKNAKGQRFVDRIRSFFGEDEESTDVESKETVE